MEYIYVQSASAFYLKLAPLAYAAGSEFPESADLWEVLADLVRIDRRGGPLVLLIMIKIVSIIQIQYNSLGKS